MRRMHGLVGLGVLAAAISGSARARGGGGEAAERAEAAEGDEKEGSIGLDLVLGWGRVPFVVENLPAAGQQSVTFSSRDGVSSSVQTFVLGGGMEVVKSIEAGFRLPLTFAHFTPGGSASRSTTSFGNVELEGEYSMDLGPGLEVAGALGVALPTAQGDEIPDLDHVSAQRVDAATFDRFSLNRAAASARGFEDNALFEPKRLGLVPKLALEYQVRALTLEGYVKVENLIATSSALANGYVGELVPALRAGYRVIPRVEVAVRGWLNVGFAGGDEDKRTTFAFEPQIVGRFGSFKPYAGVIVPVAGPPFDNGFAGVRFGAMAMF